MDPDGNPYHQVIGQTTPPPDLKYLTVSVEPDGTRTYDWDWKDVDIGNLPPDIAGFLIRQEDADLFDPVADVSFNLLDEESFTLLDASDFILMGKTGVPDWGDMNPLHEGILTDHPYTSNNPFEGGWYFAVKAIDYGGRVSINATYTDPLITNLPLPRMGDSVGYLDHFSQSPPWMIGDVEPAAIPTDCVVGAVSGFLQPIGQGTWANVVTWDGGIGTWQGTLPLSIVLEHETDVAGGHGMFPYDTEQTIDWVMETILPIGSSAVVTYHSKIKTSGVWGSWTSFTSGDPLTGTDFSFRLTVTNPDPTGVSNWIITGFATV